MVSDERTRRTYGRAFHIRRSRNPVRKQNPAREQNSSKGQAFVAELLIMLTVAIFLIVIYFVILNVINNYRSSDDKLEVQTQTAANYLVFSRGYPSDWDQFANNSSYISSLGIVSKRNIIDTAKLNSLNLTNIKYLLGLEKYNVSIVITQGVFTRYSAGNVSNETVNKILIERTCVYNGTPCTLKFSVSG